MTDLIAPPETDPTPLTAPLLSVRNLTKEFTTKGRSRGRATSETTRAVSDVSFDLWPGETLGIVGESGSGKSTTASLILRLLEATSGEVRFDGVDVLGLRGSALRALRRDIQVVFQDPFASLNPRMRVGEIIGEPLRIHGLLRGQQLDDRVAELLETVGLRPEQRSRFPHEFSGGQRQRIAIARALALRPRLIVCDEAVSALDVSIQAQILNLLKELQREHGIALIFIGHGLPAVRYISDRIAVMQLGEIVEIGPADQIVAHPQHPYTQALVASVPVASPEDRKRDE